MPGGPLAGTKVLDLSTIVSGPLCTQILGDLGADVVKIESKTGDTSRWLGGVRKADMTGFFAQWNRNKRSVVLDLKQDGGAGRGAAPRAGRRRAGRELPAGGDGAPRPRLGNARAREPAPRLRVDQRLRLGGAGRGAARLRHGDPGARRLREAARQRRRAEADLEPGRGQDQRAHRGLGHARRAARAREDRARPARRGADARRLRRLRAARRARRARLRRAARHRRREPEPVSRLADRRRPRRGGGDRGPPVRGPLPHDRPRRPGRRRALRHADGAPLERAGAVRHARERAPALEDRRAGRARAPASARRSPP